MVSPGLTREVVSYKLCGSVVSSCRTRKEQVHYRDVFLWAFFVTSDVHRSDVCVAKFGSEVLREVLFFHGRNWE